MKWIDSKQVVKLTLFVLAFCIGAFILWYGNRLADSLKDEEYKRMKLWSEATRILSSADDEEGAATGLVLEVISQNTTIPVILCDTANHILFWRNINEGDYMDSTSRYKLLNQMKSNGNVIKVDLGDGETQYLYYSDSSIIRQLSRFPMVQMVLVSLFILFGYLFFSSSQRAEQNRVWVGMAKETAHQLGTPTSSLLGWVDLLKMRETETDIADEMSKDLHRLQNVADRFSKIGSRPDLLLQPVYPIVSNLILYLSKRTSGKVVMQITPESDKSLMARVNVVLLGWVIENVLKNAIDALEGNGKIMVRISAEHRSVVIDISDNGKGMKRRLSRRIFDAGFTTKSRGWGLGMTLARRIVGDYHKGRIFVKESEPGKGTTIRLMLPMGS